MSADAVRIINRAPGIPILLGTFSPTNEEIKKGEEIMKKPSTRTPKEKEVLAEKRTTGKVRILHNNV